MKKKAYGRDATKEIVPPKTKTTFPSGKKRPERNKSKEIVPPHVKEDPYGGKKDDQTKEQIDKRKFSARMPRTFSNESLKELRKMKKEYRA